MRKTYRCRLAGFSLAELLLAMGVLAVLATLALPSMAAMVRRAQLDTTVNDFYSGLMLARAEAVKRGRRVSLCPGAADGAACDASAGWAAGFMVFADDNDNGQRDAGEDIVRVAPASRRPDLRTWSTAPLSAGISYIGTGETRALNGALQMGTVTFCLHGEGRRVVINSTGRPRLEQAGQGC